MAKMMFPGVSRTYSLKNQAKNRFLLFILSAKIPLPILIDFASDSSAFPSIIKFYNQRGDTFTPLNFSS